MKQLVKVQLLNPRYKISPSILADSFTMKSEWATQSHMFTVQVATVAIYFANELEPRLIFQIYDLNENL